MGLMTRDYWRLLEITSFVSQAIPLPAFDCLQYLAYLNTGGGNSLGTKLLIKCNHQLTAGLHDTRFLQMFVEQS